LEAWALAAIPFALIAAQPDLGTSLVIVACCAIILFQGGGNTIYLAGVLFAGLGALPFVLKEYQRDRLLSFLHPDLDPAGNGYNLIQSETALGSGGLLGKGLFHGPMSQHGFVPENHTDFIVTVVGEELGVVAVLGLLFLFFLMLLSLMRVLSRCEEPFGALLVTGVMALFAFQVVVNMGMTMGLLPVVGIPLPFCSYGGSAMITNFAALGLASSVARVQRQHA
jgi:rod shape determining protein RodA